MQHLAEGVGGQVDGGDLVELVDGVGVDVGRLQHASAHAALAQRALADRVEGHQLLLAVGGAHIHHHLFAAHKGPLVLQTPATPGPQIALPYGKYYII